MAETNTRNFPFLYQRSRACPVASKISAASNISTPTSTRPTISTRRIRRRCGMGLLHHVAELERLFEQVRATLKPGGIFLGVDHAVPTVRTIEFNALVAGWLDSLYPWITAEDPRWLYEGVTSTARQYDWGPLAVGLRSHCRARFRRVLTPTFLGNARYHPFQYARRIGTGRSMQEQAPGEDRLRRRERFRLDEKPLRGVRAVRFHTICPVIEPESHIPITATRTSASSSTICRACWLPPGKKPSRSATPTGSGSCSICCPNAPRPLAPVT